MKKRILSVALVAGAIICGTANAQTTFGVRAGVNFTNIYGKYDGGSKTENTIIPGFNIGVNAEIPLVPDFYLQPGLLLSTKGAKYKPGEGQPYTETAHLTYLEVPVNFLYKPTLGNGKLLAGFGPYVDFGVGGKIKYDGTGAPSSTSVKFKKNVSANDDQTNAYYRPFGAGANLLFGYEFANRLSFQLNTQLGLTDMMPSDSRVSAKHTEKNVGFGISAGYRF